MFIKQDDGGVLGDGNQSGRGGTGQNFDNGLGALGAVFPLEPLSPQWPGGIGWDVSSESTSPHTQLQVLGHAQNQFAYKTLNEYTNYQSGYKDQSNDRRSQGDQGDLGDQYQKPRVKSESDRDGYVSGYDSCSPEYGRRGSYQNLQPQRNDRPSFQSSDFGGDKVGRSAHNIIEQRYRNKINDRFDELLACVPALRAAYRRRSTDALKPQDEYEGDSDEDLEGLAPARKLNKGTILEKLVEYIEFLKLKNSRLIKERKRLVEQARMMGLQVEEEE